MRNVVATSLVLSLFTVLPAAAAPCPGTIVLQDSFMTPNPALDVTSNPKNKITVQGGKAEVSFQVASTGRNEIYAGTQYGDADVCGTFTTSAADKAENQLAGIIFWGVNVGAFYSFQIQPVAGQYAILQMFQGSNGSTWAVPLAWTASTAIVKTMGAANTLRVQTKGNTATLFINGQQVGTFTGTPPAGGGVVGFSASCSRTSLDTWDIADFSVAVP